MPKIRMSAWPCTGTEYCFRSSSRIRSWIGSVSPACTPITSYAAGIAWKSFRFAARGIFESANFIAWNFRRSTSVKSSSFFPRNSVGPSNIRLLSAVSMWKTLRFLSITRPIRSVERCSADRFGSM